MALFEDTAISGDFVTFNLNFGDLGLKTVHAGHLLKVDP